MTESIMKTRSLQDLLAERRANVQEMRRETDKTARAMLQFHIDQIDREIYSRHNDQTANALIMGA
jgi:hypothetical protein